MTKVAQPILESTPEEDWVIHRRIGEQLKNTFMEYEYSRKQDSQLKTKKKIYRIARLNATVIAGLNTTVITRLNATVADLFIRSHTAEAPHRPHDSLSLNAEVNEAMRMVVNR